jgi:hypothetical protein
MLRSLRHKSHAQFLLYRAIDHRIQSDDFALALEKATADDIIFINSAIQTGDKRTIVKFINDKLNTRTPFEQLGVRRLRKIAAHMRIENYHIKPKLELIGDINNAIQAAKDRTTRKFANSRRVNGEGRIIEICVRG